MTFENSIAVGEIVKQSVKIAIERFIQSETEEQLDFPSSFTALERKHVHLVAQKLGLKSKSRGRGMHRCVSIMKQPVEVQVTPAALTLSVQARQHAKALMQRLPVSSKERQELQPRTEKGYSDVRELQKTSTGRLNNGVKQVPAARKESKLDSFRAELPIYQTRAKILEGIRSNKVMMITSEAGSGKTTQVPQIILDDAHAMNKECRIICAEPRRIAATSVAERVASERGEKVGHTVGYQIRLESSVSPCTLLTFCTHGVLLRTLMGNTSLDSVTHVIIDEIHERDKFCDFLLTVLKDIIPESNCKLILISATIQEELFLEYFSCPIIKIPGSMYPVKEYFLEDILWSVDYPNLASFKKEIESNCDLSSLAKSAPTAPIFPPEPDVLTEMDNLLQESWSTGNEGIFDRIIEMIINEEIDINHAHTETSATPLMVASGRGYVESVNQLLTLGSDVKITALNGWAALEWATHYKQTRVIDILEAFEKQESLTDEMKTDDSCDPKDRLLLNYYHQHFDDDKVDVELIGSLLRKISESKEPGAVLIFLPGYDEIVALRDLILSPCRVFVSQSSFRLFVLHSQMQSSDQRKVFLPCPEGVRKVILSTNLAETSLTIPDVVFVIDAGKVKEKNFDVMSGTSSLESTWISRTSASQRKGRAGRVQSGYCYHLFSRFRHDHMQEYQTPEILRYSLHELCLHTKLLAPSSTYIADFIMKAPEPPTTLSVRKAVQLLKNIDALDSFEELTELGHHLADLPICPRLGKMILASIVLKCLDPVLTIACCASDRDPFLIPKTPSDRKLADMTRARFDSKSFSDHMVLLRAFQAWQKARTDGWETKFCEDAYMSTSTMEMIVNMRAQILGQLRASGFVKSKGPYGDIRDLNVNSENWAAIKAALVCGMYPHLLRVDRQRMKIISESETNVRFHRRSVVGLDDGRKISNFDEVISNLPTNWLIYGEMQRSGPRFTVANSCTAVTAACVILFAGPSRLSQEVIQEAEASETFTAGSDSEAEEGDEIIGKKISFQIDNLLTFRLDSESAKLFLQLRQKWQALFLRRLRNPNKQWTQNDEQILRCIVKVLSAEEQVAKLRQPSGIGQRPRPMAPDMFVTYSTPTSPEHLSGIPSLTTLSTEDAEIAEYFTGLQFVNSNASPSSSSTANSVSPSKAAHPHPYRYFIMKCQQHGNLDASMTRLLWVTDARAEHRLNRAFNSSKNVFLVFCVQHSGHFQGIARMTGPASCESHKDDDLSSIGPGTCVFTVEWLKRANVPFGATHHLDNPWNENKKVQASRNAQEVHPSIGEALVALWDAPQQQAQFLRPAPAAKQMRFIRSARASPFPGDRQYFPVGGYHTLSPVFFPYQQK